MSKDPDTYKKFHKERHEELHNRLDELIADYIAHHDQKRPSNTTVMELLEWSHEQTQNPNGGGLERDN